MAHRKSRDGLMWQVTLRSKHDLSSGDRDFIAELASEEARKVVEPFQFILHDILESKRVSRLLIEGKRCALENLVEVLEDNLDLGTTFKSLH